MHDRPVNPFVPVIERVAHDAFEVAGYSGNLVPGDLLTVTLEGDAYQEASFDLGSMVRLPMEEAPESPGRYSGSYLFRWGDGAFEGPVTGHLTGATGQEAVPSVSARTVKVDCRAHLEVAAEADLLPADRSSTSPVLIRVADANGKTVAGHPLKLALSTTDEYTGVVGGGTFGDEVGVAIDVDWGGVTDSFGEVTAEYISGFAAKTIVVSARDMVSGDIGVGWVRSFVEGEVDIVVTEPKVSALSIAGSMEVFLSRQWLTADGQSRSRITAVVKDAHGEPIAGHSVLFTLLGNNGTIRVIQGRTDPKGRAFADYIAGTVMGQVQVEVRDQASGALALVSIELRPDAPAKIELTVDPGEVVTGGQATIIARVTDANGNPNGNVDVLYDISMGKGLLNSSSVPTTKDGVATVQFTAGDTSGLVKVRGTVISRVPTAEEMEAALGAVFLYGLEEDPGRLEVVEWLVRPGEEVIEGQELVVLGDRNDVHYAVVAPRDGTVSTFAAEERDKVQYGDTLGYILPLEE
ncbi:MAG: Ig-like domain-containing protein [bacterium]|nr:Ig-like domain-containing protein [bacterium]